jgi:hypothetical protein
MMKTITLCMLFVSMAFAPAIETKACGNCTELKIQLSRAYDAKRRATSAWFHGTSYATKNQARSIASDAEQLAREIEIKLKDSKCEGFN